MGWEQQKNWYLAPTMVDPTGSVQVADGSGRATVVPGMSCHIGLTETAPTECLVGLPVGVTPLAGWRLVAPDAVPTEFERLFGRAPVENEYLTWVA